MKTPFARILYGGDYNPNQWPKEVWDEDMRLFKKAGINSATINVFSWAKLQPSEDTYNFTELDAIIAMLSEQHFDIVLATSTTGRTASAPRKAASAWSTPTGAAWWRTISSAPTSLWSCAGRWAVNRTSMGMWAAAPCRR